MPLLTRVSSFLTAQRDYVTLYRAINRATLNQCQLIGRQLTAATFNRNEN